MNRNKYTFTFLVLLSFFFSCSNTSKTPIEYVNPFIGTGFHGHTYPGATAPFGAVQLSPDTRRGNWDASSGYHYSDSTIIGFSHTHLSGTGVIDFGDILFHPTIEEVSKKNTDGYNYSPLPFSHQNEEAYPGYYAVKLDNDIIVELTSSQYVGVHRYTFPKQQSAKIIIDLHHLLDNEHIYTAELIQSGKNEISGGRVTRGWVDNQHIYFVAQFSKPFKKIDFIKDFEKTDANEGKIVGNNVQIITHFEEASKEPIVIKVGLSLVSIENARKNLKNDMPHFNFEQIKNHTVESWNKKLSKIQVESNNEDDKTNFYTALYHTMVVPNIVSDSNGEYRQNDMKIGKLPNGNIQYNTFSLWDTFRAWHPMITLLDTTMVNNMVNSMLNIYDTSGELPIWSLSAGETNTMVGYHSVSVIADAYMKGIRGFDSEKALTAMVKSSEINKKGADYYIKYGFIPSNIRKESVSCLLEFAYDDWCIAQMAKAMNKLDLYYTYIERARNYVNIFDGYSKFFRGKRMDGNWESNFNSFEPGRDYTEATAWQYRFFVPHDVNGMVQLFGGTEYFSSALDDLFNVKSDIDGEMQDITGLIGQYAHGNEPSHHMPYLYSYIGKPWKTQAMTRRILKEMYQSTPEGIVGNEDCGQMSAWYILSSLGFYSVSPGNNQFIFTTPLWNKSTIKLANGKTLTVKANNPNENLYIESITLNGDTIKSNYITYNQLMQGGELKYTLSREPNKERGISSETLPYSLSKKDFVSIPYITKDVGLFVNNIEVEVNTATPNAEIRYTLDGSEPTEKSMLYKNPIFIDKTLDIKAKGYRDGYEPSRTFTIKATKANFMRPAVLKRTNNGVKYNYYEGKYQSVKDIVKTPRVAQGYFDFPRIDKAMKNDHFGYIFEGYIYIPETDVYEFQTRSDDGSMLYINNIEIVNNDGSHAMITASGKIALQKGFHSYKLYYFEDYEGEHLSWSWKRYNEKEFKPIPKENLYR